MVVRTHPPLPADKVTLRRLAREGRRDFVASLSEGEQDRLEQRLAEVLEPHLVKSRITGGYCPLPNEISPLLAMEQAGRRGTILAYPAFNDHQSTIRFLAGEPVVPAERRWPAGHDVRHAEYGPGWVQGSGLGRVTVRFETPDSVPGRVRTFRTDDPELEPSDPLPLVAVTAGCARRPRRSKP